jgi:hypothetical protein
LRIILEGEMKVLKVQIPLKVPLSNGKSGVEQGQLMMENRIEHLEGEVEKAHEVMFLS